MALRLNPAEAGLKPGDRVVATGGYRLHDGAAVRVAERGGPGDTRAGVGSMNVAQYFVYKRPIAWTLLAVTMVAGVTSYWSMPQRQDPVIQVRSGLVTTNYPRANPIEVEQEVSRKIEKRLAENPAVEHVRSTNRQGLSIVFGDLYDTTRNAEAI